MARPIYTVQPQRRDKGWQACEEHEAQRFAVLRVEHFTSRGKRMTATRTVTAHNTRIEAQAAVDSLTGAAKKPRRLLPALGQRFQHDGQTAIIARGIGRNLATKPRS